MSLTAAEEVVKVRVQELFRAVCGGSEKQLKGLHWCIGTNAVVSVADISGDMNHVYRVSIVDTPPHGTADSASEVNDTTTTGHTSREESMGPTEASSANGTEMGKRSFSVIVKMAPRDVLFLREDEKIDVDPKKIEHEHAMLCKFHHLQEKSVPRVYTLDTNRKAIVMEDMLEYKPLTGILACGYLDDRVLIAIERTMQFVGCLHRRTLLAERDVEEKKILLDQLSNSPMRTLMSQLLFDRPFDPEDRTNRCNPLLLGSAKHVWEDMQVLEKVAAVKRAFLCQDDCLCHGDLSPDNILVQSDEFRLIDLEFSGVGLRAYDLALFLQSIMFQLLLHHHRYGSVACNLWLAIDAVLRGYSLGLESREMMDDPLFVEQVCGLIACEFMWTVFGSYHLDEFGGEAEPEQKLLSLAKAFLFDCDTQHSIAENIRQLLNKEYGLEPSCV